MDGQGKWPKIFLYFPNPPLLDRLFELLEYLDDDRLTFGFEAVELLLTLDLTSFLNELGFLFHVVVFPVLLLAYDCVP